MCAHDFTPRAALTLYLTSPRAQTWLLHFQLAYYVFDTPWTLWKGDVEQLVHHSIGVPLAAVPIYAAACGAPVAFGLFNEQGLSIFVRLVKLARLYVEKFHIVDRVLIACNWAQCGVWTSAVGVPSLFIQAYVSWRFLPAAAALLLTSALIGQACYGAYWIRRLFASYAAYRCAFVQWSAAGAGGRGAGAGAVRARPSGAADVRRREAPRRGRVRI
jgi:hypothetical protein